jgi:hypothetical protein
MGSSVQLTVSMMGRGMRHDLVCFCCRAGLYAVACFGGAAAVDLVSVMLRPLLFSGVLSLTVRFPRRAFSLPSNPACTSLTHASCACTVPSPVLRQSPLLMGSS